jgi:hypothetical protein
MAALILDDRRILNKKYPALANFPFNDFDLEIGELPIITKPTQVQLPEDTKPSKYDSPIIRFTLDKVTKFSINIHEKDLLWILDRAETISQLDTISQVVNEGMESENILKKRDSVEIADNWIKMLSDGKTMLTYSTFTEVLSALIGEQTISDTTHLINNINNLANKRGLVKLSQAEYKVVMTYYQFRLIYTKLILGLVIAAKISL